MYLFIWSLIQFKHPELFEADLVVGSRLLTHVDDDDVDDVGSEFDDVVGGYVGAMRTIE
jgi:hypothetical protein